MAAVPPDPGETQDLLTRVRAGDRQALDALFALHRPYLQQVVGLRLDPRLRPRVDPSDVVQETQLEAVRRLGDYLAKDPMPFRLWLRQIAHDRLLKLRRRHLTAARRAAGREVPLPDRSSMQLARQLLAGDPTASQQVNQQELARRLRQALAQLADPDREILLLRNFEGLSYDEAGYVLGIETAAARQRHGRALVRLHRILFADGMTESQL
jgi:RNA polymerase sigma-70 factor (ECF subfamily)